MPAADRVLASSVQTLIYAGQHMADNRQLMEYQVPPVSWNSACTHWIVVGLHGSEELTRACMKDTCFPRASDCLQHLRFCMLQGCQVMIAIETAKLKMGKPDPDSAFWN